MNLKKTILATTVAILTGTIAFSQNCDMELKEGGKMTIVLKSWANPLLYDTKFLKAKEEKKDEQIAAFNADVQVDKIAPASNTPMYFKIKKGTVNGWDEYTLTTTISGIDYSGYLFCNHDTLYQYRNRGIVRIGTAENPVGEAVHGVQKLPTNMKVGDVLTPFQDYSFLYPQTMDASVKHKVSDGLRVSTEYKNGAYIDSQTGQAQNGPYKEISLKEVFKLVDVALKQSFSFTSRTVNYAHATVTGEEQVTIAGVSYKAFIIESETWINTTMNASYESADKNFTTEQLLKDITNEDKKVKKKMAHQALKIGYTNSLGYNVTYKKEWFVPKIGIVKTAAFDTYGGISSLMTTTELQ